MGLGLEFGPAGTITITPMTTMKRAWPGLRPETRHWLTINNGKPVPGAIAMEIIEALGFSASPAWFAAPVNPEIQLSSDDIAWIRDAV